MSPKESFLEKLRREQERLDEKERAKEQREQERWNTLLARVKEEVKVKGKPFVNVLEESEILSYVNELKKMHSDLEVRFSFNLLYGDEYYLTPNFEFDWERQEFKYIGITLDNLDPYPLKDFRIEEDKVDDIVVERLNMDVMWGFYEVTGTWDRIETKCTSIHPHIERGENGFCIKIGESILSPNDWKSPEKLQDALIQAILKRD